MMIPKTNRHPNNTKTDQLPISEVITGLPRPYHIKRVTDSFFVEDLGLALTLKMCPDQSQAFKEAIKHSQAFTMGRKKHDPFFLDDPLPGAPRHVCTKFRANIGISDLCIVVPNLETNLTRRIEYILKPSNYDAKPWFLHFTTQRSKFPRRFREIWPHATVEVHHVFQRHIPHLRSFILHQKLTLEDNESASYPMNDLMAQLYNEKNIATG